jgi:hypothetical protein
VAEGARLESVYTARYPGFESLSLRHILVIGRRTALAIALRNDQSRKRYSGLLAALNSLTRQKATGQR